MFQGAEKAAHRFSSPSRRRSTTPSLPPGHYNDNIGVKRMDVEGDRLSSLPNDLIHKILSSDSIKHAVETSVLSSRWRYIWTSMPSPNFSSKDFNALRNFSKFVKSVLCSRNNQIEVSSVTYSGKVSQGFSRILNYAFSHNVQQLNITFLPGKKIESPLSLFSSKSLKYFTLTGCTYNCFITMPPTWEMPALESLNISCVTLKVENSTDKCAGLFSNLANLKNLTLKHCEVTGSDDFNICHSGLSSLTLEDVRGIRNVVQIFAPNLSSLCYKGRRFQLSGDLLHLEKVDMCIPYPNEANAHKLVCQLQQFHSVKFLTLNLELIKLLSSVVELISHQPSPFANLKCLKIYPADVSVWNEREVPNVICTEVKNYLLDSSPGATFTMVSYEEMRNVMNVTLARDLMSELRVLLDQWKENSKTNTYQMKQDMVPLGVKKHRAQRAKKRKWHPGERIVHINQQFWEAHKETSSAISMLRKIEEVLKKLPMSHQDKLQESFSSLYAKVETGMDVLVDQLKTSCDKKPKL